MTMPHEAETITPKGVPWDEFEENPSSVEAIQFLMSPDMVAGFAAGERIAFFGGDVRHDDSGYYFLINLLDGNQRCNEKGWIVRHPKKGLLVYSNEEFSEVYRRLNKPMSFSGNRFRKKPVVVEAWKVTGVLRDAAQNFNGLPKPIKDAYEKGDILFTSDATFIRTLEGEHRAAVGDWIIRGVKGELYSCKPDIFAMTYEPVDEEPQP